MATKDADYEEQLQMVESLPSYSDSVANPAQSFLSKEAALLEIAADDHLTVEKEPAKKHPLLFGITDKPPWPLSILLGLQHFLLLFGGTVSLPMLMAPKLCILPNDVGTPYLISTVFFMAGFNTLLQLTFGVRLPIIQGTTFAFLGPSFAILDLPQWKCPNTTTLEAMDYNDRQEVWQSRVRELQGAIIVSSLLEVLLGFTGLIGYIMRFIGPLTTVPTIALTGLSLFGVAGHWAGKHWGITFIVIVLVTFFSQYAPHMQWRGFSPKWEARARIACQLFPVITSVVIAWGICGILTATEVFPDSPSRYGYAARTDVKLGTLSSTPWARFPYPFQWGLPTVSLNAVSFISAVLAGIVESIGDYCACARLSGVPQPPAHAINRGIGIEGLGCILAGIWGTGSGTTSYSENIAALGITKVGSRRVIFCAAVCMMCVGIFTKFGGLMATMPDPIVGGLYCGAFGMVSAVGLSQLQNVDLNSNRNLFVLGFSMFMGLTLPEWVKGHREMMEDLTGSLQFNQILEVLLTTNMFVGGIFACLLDNVIPGTLSERGIEWGRHQQTVAEEETQEKLYGLPRVVAKVLGRCCCTQYLPFLPKSVRENAHRNESHSTSPNLAGARAEASR